MKSKLFFFTVSIFAVLICFLIYFKDFNLFTKNHKEPSNSTRTHSNKAINSKLEKKTVPIQKLTPSEIQKKLNSKRIKEEDRIALLSDLDDVNTPEALKVLDGCLDDESLDVRIEALSIISGIKSETVLPTIEKAMDDDNEKVRIAAARALSFCSIDSPLLVIKIIDDSSGNVREIGLELADAASDESKYDISEYGIHSDYLPVREKSVSMMSMIHSKKSVDILINALALKESGIHEDIYLALDYLLGKEFVKYNTAKEWWAQNQNAYNEQLELIDE